MGKLGERTWLLDLASGEAALRQAQWGAAASHFGQALTGAQRDGNVPGEARSLCGQAAALRQWGQTQLATEAIDAALALAKEDADDGVLADCLAERGALWLLQSDYERAGRAFEQALDMAPTGTHPAADAANLGLARVKLEQGKPRAAGAHAKAALSIAKRRGDQRALAAAERSLGEFCVEVDDYPGAEHHFTVAEGLAAGCGDMVGLGFARLGLGAVATARDERTQAESLYGNALALFTSLSCPLGRAISLEGLGDNAIYRDAYDEAEPLCRQAMDLYRALGHRYGIARVEESLGDLDTWQDRPYSGRAHYLASLATAGEVGSDQLRIGPLLGLAQIERSTGDLEAAFAHAEEAHDLASLVDDPTSRINALLYMGRVMLRKGRPADIERAQGCFDTGAEEAEALGEDRILLLQALTDLGDLSLKRHEDDPSAAVLDEAEAHYRRALGIAEEIRDFNGQQYARFGLGELAWRRGDAQEARNQFGAVSDISERIGEAILGSRARIEVGFTSMLDEETALIPIGDALQLITDSLERCAGIGAWDLVADGALRLIDALSPRSDYGARVLEAALTGIRAVVRLRGAQTTLKGDLYWQERFSRLVDTALHQATLSQDPKAALEAVEAARGSMVAGLMRSGELPEDTQPEIGGLLAQLDELQQRQLEVGHRSSIDDDIDHLLDRLLQLTGSFALCYAPPVEATAETLLDLVPTGTHLIAYRLSRTPEPAESRRLSIVWFEPDRRGRVSEVTIAPDLWREVIVPFSTGEASLIGEASNHPAMRRDLAELAGLLLPPELIRLLTSSRRGPVRLMLLPDDRLWFIPFPALLVGGHHLVEYASIALTPSLHTLPPARSATGAGAIAHLDPGLSISRVEQRSLSQVFHPCDLTHSREDLLLRLTPTAGRQATVIAAHGDDRAGLAQTLVQEDGTPLLSAAHMLALTLPPHVTFGACSTAIAAPRGEVQEPISLATTALARGARTVAATLWRIPKTEQTARLHNALHRRIGAGVPAPEALRQAQRAAVRANPGVELWSWAAHTMFGQP